MINGFDEEPTDYNSELTDYKAELYRKELSLEGEKKGFEYELLNGLGDTMIKELTNPTKPSKWTVFKIKVRLFLRRLSNVL